MFFTCRFSAFLARSSKRRHAEGKTSRVKRAESEDYYTWMNCFNPYSCNGPKTSVAFHSARCDLQQVDKRLHVIERKGEKLGTWEQKTVLAIQISIFPLSFKSSFRFKWWFFSNLRPIFRYVPTLIMPRLAVKRQETYADDKFVYLFAGMEEGMNAEGVAELTTTQRHRMKHRELFLSRQIETMPATHIRGKCCVTLLNETESLLSYLNKEDFFFYCLVYDPSQKTLLADKGKPRATGFALKIFTSHVANFDDEKDNYLNFTINDWLN